VDQLLLHQILDMLELLNSKFQLLDGQAIVDLSNIEFGTVIHKLVRRLQLLYIIIGQLKILYSIFKQQQ
jgi:hypothetical protein